jgi:hypothetical protein
MSDDVRHELMRDGKAYGRSKRAAEKDRERLGETIEKAAGEGLGVAEITKLIGYTLTERTVFRLVNKPERDAKSA